MMNSLTSPTPAAIRAAREAAGLTQAQAAFRVHVDARSWRKWENGERAMHNAFWELFQLKTGRGNLASGVSGRL